MFWILCARTGTRELIDAEASDLVRIRAVQTPVSR
jgi:hypothetical protein